MALASPPFKEKELSKAKQRWVEMQDIQPARFSGMEEVEGVRVGFGGAVVREERGK